MSWVGKRLRFWHFDEGLLFYRMNDDCAVRPDRADVLAAAAADADRRVCLWNHQIIFIRNHAHSLGRAVLGAGAAVVAVGFDYAELFDIFDFADLHELLFISLDRLNRVNRADLRTEIAVLLAHAQFEIE